MERMDFQVTPSPQPNMEIRTEYGTLSFEIKENEAILNSYSGRDAFIEIPGFVYDIDKEESSENGEGEKEIPVTRIERKAFLSDKYIAEIIIPSSVREIGDWGFAGCTSLLRVVCSSEIVLGKDVFKDCRSLAQIVTADASFSDKRTTDVSFLLVAAHTLLQDRLLFDLHWAGFDEWLEHWDMKLGQILDGHDDEGFVSLVAGGEEDYESEMQTLEGFISAKRKNKIRLCFVRLLNDYGLNQNLRQRLMGYLRAHRAGAFYNIEPYENGMGYSDNGYLGRTRTVSIEEISSSAALGEIALAVIRISISP